jgi:hypothetical protein
LWFNVLITMKLVFCVIGIYFCFVHKCHHTLLLKYPELSCTMRSLCLYHLSPVANSKQSVCDLSSLTQMNNYHYHTSYFFKDPTSHVTQKPALRTPLCTLQCTVYWRLVCRNWLTLSSSY